MDGPSLPRSIRWRLQLGLLALPNSKDDEEEDGSEEPTMLTEQDLYEYNASLMHDQRQRYLDLREQHREALEAFRNESHHRDESNDETSNDVPAQDTASTSTDATLLDPLTAMVREQEAQEKRRQELELKYRKERARRNRGISDEAGASHHNGESSKNTGNTVRSVCCFSMNKTNKKLIIQIPRSLAT